MKVLMGDLEGKGKLRMYGLFNRRKEKTEGFYFQTMWIHISSWFIFTVILMEI